MSTRSVIVGDGGGCSHGFTIQGFARAKIARLSFAALSSEQPGPNKPRLGWLSRSVLAVCPGLRQEPVFCFRSVFVLFSLFSFFCVALEFFGSLGNTLFEESKREERAGDAKWTPDAGHLTL